MNISEKSTPRGAGRLGPHDVEGLLDFADNVLPTLRHADGLFCFDRSFDSPELRGVSVRYSILVLLGLLRRQMTGHETAIDVENLHRAIASRAGEMDVGDLSLLLWAEVRMGAASATDTLARLDRRSRDHDHLARLEGMEAAWFVLGTAEATSAGLPARERFDAAYAHFQSRRSRASALFRHNATGRGRAHLPNFATQIYSLLALAETARHELAPEAASAGRSLADTLIELRLPDAGWPWLFHADRGSVVEPYEVYSVHQDAMAPMALFALAEATGDQDYARAAVEGFQWCFGNNELGSDFYDQANLFAHRSIKRRGWAHAVNLWTNTALGGVLGSTARTDIGGLEINATCRPYHLGWILEAWSGREHHHSLVTSEPTNEVVR